MLVQALVEYAQTRLQDQLADPAFEDKPVPFQIDLAPDGTFLAVVPRQDVVAVGKKTVTRPRMANIPKSPVNRNSGLHPLLGCDDLKYVLGPGNWTEPRDHQNHLERFQAFANLTAKAAAATQDPALIACQAFYSNQTDVDRARLALAAAGAVTGNLVALSVDRPIIDRLAVRAYWRDHFGVASEQRVGVGGDVMCLISGRICRVPPTHNKIKGTPGGQPAGVALMSFDKQAFQSYGWSQNANSPVAPECATAYVLALNHLLASRRTGRHDHAGVAFLYWTKKPIADELDAMALIENADPAQILNLLKLKTSNFAGAEANEFYFLGAAANGARFLVRYWIYRSLEDVLANVSAWFQDLRIADVFTREIAAAPPVWRICKTLAREEPESGLVLQLFRRALHGVPLGGSVLAKALARLRIGRGSERLNPVRAALIRLALNDRLKLTSAGDTFMPEVLDDGLNHRAYLSGRLLALYDGLQYAAHDGSVGVTVADRFFSLASTNPALAFPAVVNLGQKHLKKLRGAKPGAAINIERQISSLMSRLAADGASFPRSLSLEDQGRFAIGFHHQRADSMARAAEMRASREQTSDLQKEIS